MPTRLAVLSACVLGVVLTTAGCIPSDASFGIPKPNSACWLLTPGIATSVMGTAMSSAPENVEDNCSYSGTKGGSPVDLSLVLYPGKNFVTSFESMAKYPPGPTTLVNGRIALWLPGEEGGVPDGFLDTSDGNYVMYLIAQAPSGAKQIAEKALQAAERRLVG